MPSLRIAPPALRSSTISSGLPQWSVASLAPWWQGWSQKWWFVLGLDLLPEQWSCWPCWLLVFHHSPWGGCTWSPAPTSRVLWVPPSLLTWICYISFCLFTVLLTKAWLGNLTQLLMCMHKEHSWPTSPENREKCWPFVHSSLPHTKKKD